MAVNNSLNSARRYLERHKGLDKPGRRGLQESCTWLPKMPTERKFNNPWGSGRMSLFDYSKQLKSLIADMVMYGVIVQMKRTKMFAMRPMEECRRIYSDLVSRAYYKAVKGLPCWKPTYDILGFVNSHVNFAWLELYNEEKRELDLFNSAIPIPENWSLSYQKSLELAEELAFCDRTDEAADLFERMASEVPDAEEDGD